MTIVAANWVGENTSTVGTGPLALSGAISKFCPFSVLPDGSEVYYTLQEGFNRETGIGVVSNGTLTRKVQATLVAGVYTETNIPISLIGNGQVFAVINADFMTRIYNFSLGVADSVSAAAASAKSSSDSASLANDYKTQSAQSAKNAASSAQSASDSKSDATASKNAAAASASAAASSQANAANSAAAAANSAAFVRQYQPNTALQLFTSFVNATSGNTMNNNLMDGVYPVTADSPGAPLAVDGKVWVTHRGTNIQQTWESQSAAGSVTYGRKFFRTGVDNGSGGITWGDWREHVFMDLNRIAKVLRGVDSSFDANGPISSINTLTSMPANDTVTEGGRVHSAINVHSGELIGASIKARYQISSTGAIFKRLVLGVNGGSGEVRVSDDGSLGVDGGLVVSSGANITGDATVTGKLSSIGNATFSTVNCGSIELLSNTPYIDFKFDASSKDYTMRFINKTNADTMYLSAEAPGDARFRVDGGFQCKSGIGGNWNDSTFNFYWNTSYKLEAWVDASKIGEVQVTAASDKMLKTTPDYKSSNGVLDEVMKWKVASFKYKARGIIPESDEKLGFIANDLVTVSPECVIGEGLPDDYDIEAEPNQPGAYNLDQVAMIAKLTMAIQDMQSIVSDLRTKVDSLKSQGSSS